jgi:SAM-dependent methyltransferase
MNRVRLLFGGAVFLASFLLFLVEPMAAKQLLPQLGGSAAVWITCLVFFQTALLLAYLYAHWLTRRLQWVLHCLLMVLAVISSISWTLSKLGSGQPSDHPVATIFLALSVSIGLPFLMLGATSPLLQVWWSRVENGAIPYKLYALSNLASLLALALYPTLIEPRLTLHAQRLAWCCGFAVFAVLSVALSLATRTANLSVRSAFSDDDQIPSAPLSHRVLWVLLPMGAAMQLSSVTSYLTANVAAIPLLWILPLGVYLLTLIFAFQFPQFLRRSLVSRFLVVMLASLGYMLAQVNVTLPMGIGILFFLAEVLVSCLFCHSEAYALRPRRKSETTLFYLLFAAGGALGSFLIGIVSPLAFRFNYDLPLTFFVTALLALAVTWVTGWSQRLLWLVASAAMLIMVFLVHTAYQRDTTIAIRNFYGSLRVKQDHGYAGATLRTLLNGSIQHGTQIFGTEQLRRMPTTYYARDSGVGLALSQCCAGRTKRVGVIGLGAGTLAAYGQPGDQFRFYEINPAVAPIAKNAFTYIRDSGAQIEIIEGDARTSLARENPQQFDVLVVDAFTGDAIPLHLLTTQALALYRRHLAPGGVLVFHISNQHVDLGPPIALLAASAGLQVRRVSSMANDERAEFTATWMLVSDSDSFFAQPAIRDHSSVPQLKTGLRVWTDDYSSLLPALHW